MKKLKWFSQTYATYLFKEFIRQDETHQIEIVFFRDYKGLYGNFYVNHLDPKQVKMLNHFIMSTSKVFGKKENVLIDFGCYQNNFKLYLLNVTNKEYI